MESPQKITPPTALAVGLIVVAAGILPMLAAFDMGPLTQEDIHGPPWVGFVAGGIFVAAGLAVMAGPHSSWAGALFGLMALAGLAAIGNWIAFGMGERACTGSLSLSWNWGAGDLSGLGCRVPFGLGALIADAFLCHQVVSVMQKVLGGPPRLARLVKASEWLLICSLLPFILLLAVIGIGAAAVGAVRTRLSTGAWPRNEAFIARQKAKGLPWRLGRKPPDQPK